MKYKFRRVLSILLTVAMLLSLLPAGALAADDDIPAPPDFGDDDTPSEDVNSMTVQSSSFRISSNGTPSFTLNVSGVPKDAYIRVTFVSDMAGVQGTNDNGTITLDSDYSVWGGYSHPEVDEDTLKEQLYNSFPVWVYTIHVTGNGGTMVLTETAADGYDVTALDVQAGAVFGTFREITTGATDGDGYSYAGINAENLKYKAMVGATAADSTVSGGGALDRVYDVVIEGAAGVPFLTGATDAVEQEDDETALGGVYFFDGSETDYPENAKVTVKNVGTGDATALKFSLANSDGTQYSTSGVTITTDNLATKLEKNGNSTEVIINFTNFGGEDFVETVYLRVDYKNGDEEMEPLLVPITFTDASDPILEPTEVEFSVYAGETGDSGTVTITDIVQAFTSFKYPGIITYRVDNSSAKDAAGGVVSRIGKFDYADANGVPFESYSGNNGTITGIAISSNAYSTDVKFTYDASDNEPGDVLEFGVMMVHTRKNTAMTVLEVGTITVRVYVLARAMLVANPSSLSLTSSDGGANPNPTIELRANGTGSVNIIGIHTSPIGIEYDSGTTVGTGWVNDNDTEIKASVGALTGGSDYTSTLTYPFETATGGTGTDTIYVDYVDATGVPKTLEIPVSVAGSVLTGNDVVIQVEPGSTATGTLTVTPSSSWTADGVTWTVNGSDPYTLGTSVSIDGTTEGRTLALAAATGTTLPTNNSSISSETSYKFTATAGENAEVGDEVTFAAKFSGLSGFAARTFNIRVVVVEETTEPEPEPTTATVTITKGGDAWTDTENGFAAPTRVAIVTSGGTVPSGANDGVELSGGSASVTGTAGSNYDVYAYRDGSWEKVGSIAAFAANGEYSYNYFSVTGVGGTGGTVTFTTGDGNTEGYIAENTTTNSLLYITSNEPCTVYFTVAPNTGYQLASTPYIIDGAEPGENTTPPASGNPNYEAGAGHESDVTITAQTEAIYQFGLKINLNDAALSGSSTAPSITGVTIGGKDATYDSTRGAWIIADTDALPAGTYAWSATVNSETTPKTGNFAFSSSAQDATLNLHTVKVANSANGAVAKFSDDTTAAKIYASGDTGISVKATAASGYELTGWSITPASGAGTPSSSTPFDTATLNIPANYAGNANGITLTPTDNKTGSDVSLTININGTAQTSAGGTGDAVTSVKIGADSLSASNATTPTSSSNEWTGIEPQGSNYNFYVTTKDGATHTVAATADAVLNLYTVTVAAGVGNDGTTAPSITVHSAVPSGSTFAGTTAYVTANDQLTLDEGSIKTGYTHTDWSVAVDGATGTTALGNKTTYTADTTNKAVTLTPTYTWEHTVKTVHTPSSGSATGVATTVELYYDVDGTATNANATVTAVSGQTGVYTVTGLAVGTTYTVYVNGYATAMTTLAHNMSENTEDTADGIITTAGAGGETTVTMYTITPTVEYVYDNSGTWDETSWDNTAVGTGVGTASATVTISTDPNDATTVYVPHGATNVAVAIAAADGNDNNRYVIKNAGATTLGSVTTDTTVDAKFNPHLKVTLGEALDKSDDPLSAITTYNASVNSVTAMTYDGSNAAEQYIPVTTADGKAAITAAAPTNFGTAHKFKSWMVEGEGGAYAALVSSIAADTTIQPAFYALPTFTGGGWTYDLNEDKYTVTAGGADLATNGEQFIWTANDAGTPVFTVTDKDSTPYTGDNFKAGTHYTFDNSTGKLTIAESFLASLPTGTHTINFTAYVPNTSSDDADKHSLTTALTFSTAATGAELENVFIDNNDLEKNDQQVTSVAWTETVAYDSHTPGTVSTSHMEWQWYYADKKPTQEVVTTAPDASINGWTAISGATTNTLTGLSSYAGKYVFAVVTASGSTLDNTYFAVTNAIAVNYDAQITVNVDGTAIDEDDAVDYIVEIWSTDASPVKVATSDGTDPTITFDETTDKFITENGALTGDADYTVKVSPYEGAPNTATLVALTDTLTAPGTSAVDNRAVADYYTVANEGVNVINATVGTSPDTIDLGTITTTKFPIADRTVSMKIDSADVTAVLSGQTVTFTAAEPSDAATVTYDYEWQWQTKGTNNSYADIESATAKTYSKAITAPTTLRANYTQNTYPLAVEVTGDGTLDTLVIKTPGDETIVSATNVTKDSDSTVTVPNLPASSYVVTMTPSTNPDTIIFGRDHTYTAKDANTMTDTIGTDGAFGIEVGSSDNKLAIKTNEDWQVLPPAGDDPDDAGEAQPIGANVEIEVNVIYGSGTATIATLIGNPQTTAGQNFYDVKVEAPTVADGAETDFTASALTGDVSQLNGGTTADDLANGNTATFDLVFDNVSGTDPLDVGEYEGVYTIKGKVIPNGDEITLATYTLTVNVVPATVTDLYLNGVPTSLTTGGTPTAADALKLYPATSGDTSNSSNEGKVTVDKTPYGGNEETEPRASVATVEKIEWFAAGSSDALGASDKFAAGTAYTAVVTIKLSDAANYTFASANLADYEDDTTNDNVDNPLAALGTQNATTKTYDTVTLTYTFPATAPTEPEIDAEGGSANGPTGTINTISVETNTAVDIYYVVVEKLASDAAVPTKQEIFDASGSFTYKATGDSTTAHVNGINPEFDTNTGNTIATWGDGTTAIENITSGLTAGTTYTVYAIAVPAGATTVDAASGVAYKDFTTWYEVELEVSPANSGTATFTGQQSTVTTMYGNAENGIGITATANPNWAFSKWEITYGDGTWDDGDTDTSGDEEKKQNPTYFYPRKNTTLVANFTGLPELDFQDTSTVTKNLGNGYSVGAEVDTDTLENIGNAITGDITFSIKYKLTNAADYTENTGDNEFFEIESDLTGETKTLAAGASKLVKLKMKKISLPVGEYEVVVTATEGSTTGSYDSFTVNLTIVAGNIILDPTSITWDTHSEKVTSLSTPAEDWVISIDDTNSVVTDFDTGSTDHVKYIGKTAPASGTTAETAYSTAPSTGWTTTQVAYATNEGTKTITIDGAAIQSYIETLNIDGDTTNDVGVGDKMYFVMKVNCTTGNQPHYEYLTVTVADTSRTIIAVELDPDANVEPGTAATSVKSITYEWYGEDGTDPDAGNGTLNATEIATAITDGEIALSWALGTDANDDGMLDGGESWTTSGTDNEVAYDLDEGNLGKLIQVTAKAADSAKVYKTKMSAADPTTEDPATATATTAWLVTLEVVRPTAGGGKVTAPTAVPHGDPLEFTKSVYFEHTNGAATPQTITASPAFNATPAKTATDVFLGWEVSSSGVTGSETADGTFLTAVTGGTAATTQSTIAAFAPTKSGATLTAHFGIMPKVEVVDGNYDIGNGATGTNTLPSYTYTSGINSDGSYLAEPTITVATTSETLEEDTHYTVTENESGKSYTVEFTEAGAKLLGKGSYTVTFENGFTDVGSGTITADLMAGLTITETKLALDSISFFKDDLLATGAVGGNTATTNVWLDDILYTKVVGENDTPVAAGDVTYTWTVAGTEDDTATNSSFDTALGTTAVTFVVTATPTENGNFTGDPVSKEITLYPPKYTVIVKTPIADSGKTAGTGSLTGGTTVPGGTDLTLAVNYGSAATIGATPSAGYKFTGWEIVDTDPDDGNGAFGSFNGAVTSTTASTTFYPKTSSVTITPKFEAVEITVSPIELEILYGDSEFVGGATDATFAPTTAGSDTFTYAITNTGDIPAWLDTTNFAATGKVSIKSAALRVDVKSDSADSYVEPAAAEVVLNVTVTSNGNGDAETTTLSINIEPSDLTISGITGYNGAKENEAVDPSKFVGTLKVENTNNSSDVLGDDDVAKLNWAVDPAFAESNSATHTFIATYKGTTTSWNYNKGEITLNGIKVEKPAYGLTLNDSTNSTQNKDYTYKTTLDTIPVVLKNNGTEVLHNVALTISGANAADFDVKIGGTPISSGHEITTAPANTVLATLEIVAKDPQSWHTGSTHTITITAAGAKDAADGTPKDVIAEYTLTITVKPIVIDEVTVNVDAPTIGGTLDNTPEPADPDEYVITDWQWVDTTTNTPVSTMGNPQDVTVDDGHNYRLDVTVEPKDKTNTTFDNTTKYYINDEQDTSPDTTTPGSATIDRTWTFGDVTFPIEVEVAAPVTGSPLGTPTAKDTTKYTITNVIWYDSEGNIYAPGTTAEADTTYTLWVEVKVTAPNDNGDVTTREVNDNTLTGGTFNATAPSGSGYSTSGTADNNLWYTFTKTGADSTGTPDPTPPPSGGGTPSTPKHEITYVPGPNGTTDDPLTEEVKEGDTPENVPEITPTDDEYVFIGWITTNPETLGEDEEITIVNPEEVVIDGPTDFFAVVTKKEIKVTYELGSFGTTTDETLEIVAKYQYPSFTPEVSIIESAKDLATFVGWSLEKPDHVLEVELVDPLTVQILKDTVFYAVYEITEYEYHEHYMIGYPDGNFEPDQDITRAEVATIIARAVLKDFIEGSWYGDGGYTDMQGDHWAKSAIAFVTAAGIFEGYEDGTFRPNQPITRQEYATVIARLKGLLDGNREDLTQFTDYEEISEWAIDGVYTCVEEGWIIGYEDDTFKARKDITRAEAAKMMNGYLNRGVDEPGISTVPEYIQFPDVYWGHWAYWHVAEAVNDHYYYYYYVDVDGNDTPPEQWVIEAGYLNVKLDDNDPDNTKNVRRSDPIYVNSISAGTGSSN